MSFHGTCTGTFEVTIGTVLSLNHGMDRSDMPCEIALNVSLIGACVTLMDVPLYMHGLNVFLYSSITE